MSTIPIYQVDAFASRVFTGNPAAVCPLNEWLPDVVLQHIAAENNLAETAFFVPGETPLRLRWFTPTVEVDLCGHATLAAAYVLFHELGLPGAAIDFITLSGIVSVNRVGDLLSLDFPARPCVPVPDNPQLSAALDASVTALFANPRDYVAVFKNDAEVRALKPNFAALRQSGRPLVIATAPCNEADFVCRVFAPAFGIAEDPVTGSAYCTLAPFWSQQLGKKKLFARQVSARGGEVWCEERGDRVHIAGKAVLVLRGELLNLP